jgi:hypothetical protein
MYETARRVARTAAEGEMCRLPSPGIVHPGGVVTATARPPRPHALPEVTHPWPALNGGGAMACWSMKKPWPPGARGGGGLSTQTMPPA